MEEIKKTLNRYVDHRLPTGGFLQSVLENDLMGAMGMADHINRQRIFDICRYVYNNLPPNCWGSPEKVKEWLNKK